MAPGHGERDAAAVVRALEEVERLLVELRGGGDREATARELAGIRETLRRLREGAEIRPAEREP